VVSAVFLPALAAAILDQNAPHSFRGSGEEMAAAVPVLGLLDIHQPEVGFVDQGRGLERLPGLLLGEFLRRELAQLLIDQGQELLRGVRIATLNGGQDLRNLAHRRPTLKDSKESSSLTFVNTVRDGSPAQGATLLKRQIFLFTK
jgi:hypothetical protein